ncbi:MAG: hypothetical protein Q8N36_05665, partial [bacterium]|nr:hypothetical protein [bacterium]
SCGAQTILEEANMAQACAFCGSSHVVKQEEIPGILPESVLPFSIVLSKAQESFHKWLSKRYFAPSDLASKHRGNKITGVYIPYWTFDASTYSLYTAQKGTHYYVTEWVSVTRKGRTARESRQVRKTRWASVRGSFGASYDDELIHASKRLDSIIKGKVGIFNLSKLTPYKSQYLAGFVAEKYTVALAQAWETGKTKIKEKINLGIIRQINGDEVRALQFNTSFSNTTYKLTLLPLWVSGFYYKDKLYSFVVNGQTGELYGEAPISVAKVALLIITIIAIIGVILLFSQT